MANPVTNCITEAQEEQLEMNDISSIGGRVSVECNGQMDHFMQDLVVMMRERVNAEYRTRMDQFIRNKDIEYSERLQNEINERENRLLEHIKNKDFEYSEKLQNEVNENEKRLEEFFKKKDQEYSEKLHNEISDKEKSLEKHKELSLSSEIEKMKKEVAESMQRIRIDIETEITTRIQSKVEQLEIDLEYYKNLHKKTKKYINQLLEEMQDKINAVENHQGLVVESDKKQEISGMALFLKQIIDGKEKEIYHLLEKNCLEKVTKLNNTNGDKKQKLQGSVDGLSIQSENTETYTRKIVEQQNMPNNEVDNRTVLEIHKLEKQINMNVDHIMVTYTKQHSLQDGSMPRLPPLQDTPETPILQDGLTPLHPSPQNFSEHISGLPQINITAIRENITTSPIYEVPLLAGPYLNNIKNALKRFESDETNRNLLAIYETKNHDHNYGTNIEPEPLFNGNHDSVTTVQKDSIVNIIPENTFGQVNFTKVDPNFDTTMDIPDNFCGLSFMKVDSNFTDIDIPDDFCDVSFTKVDPHLVTDIVASNYGQASATPVEHDCHTKHKQGLVTETIVMCDNCDRHAMDTSLDHDSVSNAVTKLKQNSAGKPKQDVVTSILENSDVNPNNEPISDSIVMCNNYSHGLEDNDQRNLEIYNPSKRPRLLSRKVAVVLKQCSLDDAKILKRDSSRRSVSPNPNKAHKVAVEREDDTGKMEERNVQVHQRIINREKRYVCEQCDRGYTLSCNLTRHKKKCCGKQELICEKRYVCKQCDRRFTQSKYLKQHLKICCRKRKNIRIKIHSSKDKFGKCVSDQGNLKETTQCENAKEYKGLKHGEKPYVCGECGKVFKHISHLSIHRRIHSGTKPYVCQVCDKGFAQAGNLRGHLKYHSRLNETMGFV